LADEGSTFLTVPEGRVSCMAAMAPLMLFSWFSNVIADALQTQLQGAYQ